MTGDLVVQLPLPRYGVLDIAPQYRALRAEAALTRVSTCNGHPAWLVTSYSAARRIFADEANFGIFVDPGPAEQDSPTVSPFQRDMARMLADYEHHITRLRTLTAPLFSLKRLRQWETRIRQLTDGCLDDLAAARERNAGAPADFHDLVGFRLPGLVICALIGVPDDDRDYVIGLSERIGSSVDGARTAAAIAELRSYAARLLPVKRTARSDDVFSHLLSVQDSDPDSLSDADLKYYAMGLLVPGHETTTARLDFGLLYLLSQPTRWKWLLADADARLDGAVEEILRMTAPHHTGLTRHALRDIEICGVAVARGDLVIISELAANRDPAAFGNPNDFNPERTPNNHIAFGHGRHHCIGQNLARTQLRIAFRSLLQRFPDLRLAVDVEELEILDTRTAGGVCSVPVTW